MTKNGEIAAATKQTVETLMAGERIAEALELGMADLNVIREWEEAKLSQHSLAPAHSVTRYSSRWGTSAPRRMC